MSNLRQKNGDDYPEAARKHLDDAEVLLNAGRYDGSGYHAGYVVECALKTLIQIDGTVLKHHDLSLLSNKVTQLATGGSPHTSRYLLNPPPAISYADPPVGWKETMRYRAAGDLNQAQAKTWFDEAKRTYKQTVQAMLKNGDIR